MSQENVELVRGGYEWFRANGRFPGHLSTPDFVWDMSNFRGWPEQQVYEGAQGVEDFFAEWGSAWDDWEVGVEALHDLGNQVLAIVRQRGTSKLNGMVVEMPLAQLWTFREGRQSRMEMYSDPREALEAVGLEE